MPPTPYVCLALTTTLPTHDWGFGQKALALLYGDDPRLTPEKIGLDDSDMRKKHPCATLADVQPLWAPVTDVSDDMYSALDWRRAKAMKAKGTFGQTGHNRFGRVLPATVRLNASYAPDFDYVFLFRAWCDLYRPTQAYLHLLTQAEAPKGFATTAGLGGWEQGWDTFRYGGFGALLAQKTYNLGAINYFPHDFLTDAQRADLQALGCSVTPFAGGHILGLCDALDDLKTDFPAFSARRAQAKRSIGRQRFEIGNEPTPP